MITNDPVHIIHLVDTKIKQLRSIIANILFYYNILYPNTVTFQGPHNIILNNNYMMVF